MSKDKGGFSIIISKHHHPSVYITAVELIYGDMHLLGRGGRLIDL
jgi:hypothetical protein